MPCSDANIGKRRAQETKQENIAQQGCAASKTPESPSRLPIQNEQDAKNQITNPLKNQSSSGSTGQQR